MIVSKDDMRQIRQGKLDEVVYDYSPPPVGTVQAVQTKVGKPARCYVLIEDRWEITAGDDKGKWAVRFKLHHQEAPARFLSKGAGYTDSSASALRFDGEPEEAVPAEVQDEITAQARTSAKHERAKRRSDQELLDSEARIKAYRDEARHRRIDVSKESRLLNKLLREKRPVDTPLAQIRKKLDRDLDRKAA